LEEAIASICVAPLTEMAWMGRFRPEPPRICRYIRSVKPDSPFYYRVIELLLGYRGLGYQEKDPGDQSIHAALSDHHEESGLETLAGIRFLEEIFLEQCEVAKGQENSSNGQSELHRPRDLQS
jgi:hypothetical protein